MFHLFPSLRVVAMKDSPVLYQLVEMSPIFSSFLCLCPYAYAFSCPSFSSFLCYAYDVKMMIQMIRGSIFFGRLAEGDISFEVVMFIPREDSCIALGPKWPNAST